MKKSIFAVCDLEVEYAHNFMDYLNCKRSIPFEIQAFTSVEHLTAYAQSHPIEILLISDKAMCDKVRELSIGQITILSEGVHPPELDQYPSVYKYQSSENVLREVMACYSAEKESPLEENISKKKMEIIGIYSPLGRTLKTSFALTLGQILSRERAVLYLNLEGYSGFEAIMEQKYEHTLSDVMYFVRQQNKNLVHKISSMTETIGNMDYLPPAESPEDIRNTTVEEWQYLLDVLTLGSSYEVLILDLNDCVDSVFQILERCHTIYVPTLSDKISEAKLGQMEKLLNSWNLNDLKNRIRKIKLPFHSGLEIGKGYIEQLPYSELGDYVRRLRYGENG